MATSDCLCRRSEYVPLCLPHLRVMSSRARKKVVCSVVGMSLEDGLGGAKSHERSFMRARPVMRSSISFQGLAASESEREEE